VNLLYNLQQRDFVVFGPAGYNLEIHLEVPHGAESRRISRAIAELYVRGFAAPKFVAGWFRFGVGGGDLARDFRHIE
jgi:hypothetical protein